MLPEPTRKAPMHTLFPEHEVHALNERFESVTAQEIVRWAFEDSGIERIALASAFQAEGTCIMHMASTIRPDVEVLFLETGFHFAETLAFKEHMAERLSVTITDLVGTYTVEQQNAEFGERLYERDPGLCCEVNKVRPMFDALQKLDAWITAFRRDSSPTRANAPILDRYELEPGRPMLKINPVATWTRADTLAYLERYDLPHNPLYDLGYTSIGCAPCTRMRFEGEPERAGRWAGLSKWECGIHQREAREQADRAGRASRG
jgi:phosphoadenosine phosphosulfate reductase